MLKRKEFVIQWRKFGSKRSSTFKVMNLWSLCPFSDFYLIFKLIFRLIFPIKIAKKRGVFYFIPQTPWRLTWCKPAEEARSWRGARDCRTDATWRWGHVAGPLVAHARRRRCTGHRHVAGGHTYPHGPRGRPCGAPHGRGMADGGPTG